MFTITILLKRTYKRKIRHVLETVCRFEYPKKSFVNYIKENETLSEDACIYTLCQDLSHGGVRNQKPNTEKMLVNACQTVEIFMKSKYEGQLKAISD